MECRVIDGRGIAASIKEELKVKIEKLKEKRKIVPGLAAILAGSDDASKAYVSNIDKLCGRLGVFTLKYEMDGNIKTDDVVELIHNLNEDKKIHGIIAQLPLPRGVDEKAVCEAISPYKDVDGINPLNAGKLYTGGKCFLPCTPKGIIRLIEHTGIDLCGKHAVVIGRSNIVGKPAAMLLLNKNATVTVCHSKTNSLGDFARNADILVSAVGKPGIIRGGMIKPGAVVIDAGTRVIEGKLVGDIAFDEAREVASWITPVPGGVGSMTTAMLVENVLEAVDINVY